MGTMATEPEPRPSITKVWAKNFRSIEYAELELGPLTVLVGPNASGKSNLLDILRFLADAARDGLEATVTRRGGIDYICRRSSPKKVFGPEIGFLYEFPSATLEYSFALMRQSRGEYRVKREFARLIATDSGFDSCEIEVVNGRLTKPDIKMMLKNTEFTEAEDDVLATSLASQINQHIAALDIPVLLLIAAEPLLPDVLLYILRSLSNQERIIISLNLLREALRLARDNLRSIGVLAIFPNLLRSPQMIADRGNFASVLWDMEKKNQFLPELKETLAFAVPGVRDIRVKKAGSYYVVELEHERNDGVRKGLWFDLAQESDGTIRLLAMLTALFQDPAPSLIGLEEPELAIHPGAMAVMADTMKEASLRGQVLVATHSPDLINLLPLDSIRAVTAEDGSTRVGRIAEHQLRAVKDKLFLPGELHSLEGLQPAGAGERTE
jgi:predicted ATPase